MGRRSIPGPMTLLSRLKSMLGVGGDERDRSGTTVTVEAEPDAASERAVKDAVTSDPAEAEPSGSEGDGTAVDTLSGVGPAYAGRLAEAGIETVDDLADADPAALDEATDIGEGRLAGWIEQARSR